MAGRRCSQVAVVLLLLSSWTGAFASNASAAANATGASSSSSSSASTATSSRVGSGRRMSALRSWLGDLTVPIPANMTFAMPMNMGELAVAAGSSCQGLRVGDLVPKDNSSGEVLEWDVYLSGVGVSCHIEGESLGSLSMDLTLASSSLHASVQIHPLYPEATPDLPLPLGHFNMTSCTASINIVDFNISGSAPLVSLINGINRSILLPLMGIYVNQPLCTGAKHLLETNGTASLRQGATMMERLLLPPKALPSPKPVKPVLDWGTYPPVVVMQALLHERFSMWANRMISVVNFSSILQARLIKTENISLVLSDIFVDGLVTHREVPGLSLSTSGLYGSTLGLFANLHGLALRSTLSLEVALPDEPVLRETFDVSIGLENMSLAVRAFADKPKLDSLALDAGHVMHSPGCLLECTVGTTAAQEEPIAFESMDVALRPVFNMHPVEGDLETESTALINTVVGSLYAGYFPTVSALAHGALGMARHPLNEWLWNKLAELPCADGGLLLGLNEAASRSVLGVAAAFFAVGVIAAGFTWWCWDRRACSKDDGATASEIQDAVSEASTVTTADVDAGVCLARQAFVPRALSVFYPFALIGVTCLFLYADLQTGATVSVVMATNEESTTIGPVFSFSLLSTVVHSWQSGAYVISLIAALTSGFWPFCKLGLLLAMWLLPPQVLSAKTRGRILGFLNTWGKYSFVDCWFLVLTMSAFAIQWHSIGDAYMTVRTTPTAAFYVFFVSTGLSLILGHVASECHTHAENMRHRVSEPVELAAAQGGPEETEADAQEAAVPTQRHPQTSVALSAFAAPRWARVAVASALGASAALMLASIFLISFDFEIGGIFIEFLFGHEVSRQYSLLGVGMAVTEGGAGDAGLLGLEVVFLILAVVVPLVLLTTLSILWLMPMKLHSQKALLRVCYILDTWSSLDVAVLVLVVASFEFGKLADFLVYRGDLATPCHMVRDLTSTECVHIGLTSRPAIAVLLVAGFALLVLPKVAMRLCAGAIFREARSPIVAKQVEEAKQAVHPPAASFQARPAEGDESRAESV